MLVKLRPAVNFINILCTNFLYERHFGSFYYVHVTKKKAAEWHSHKKCGCLTLMKLTAVVNLTNIYNQLLHQYSFAKKLQSFFTLSSENLQKQ